MIRPLAALTRQVQDFFHTHLVGIYRWDEVAFGAREKNINPPPETWERNSRGRRIRPEPKEGKYHAAIRLQFGVWDLTIEGPNEHPPLGWLSLQGFEKLEGPLDAATWKRFGEHIKAIHEEHQNVA